MFLFNPAGGAGDASSRVHLSVQAEGDAPGAAGGGEESTGSLPPGETPTLRPARRTGEAAECR